MIPLARRKLRCRGGGVGGIPFFSLLANLSVPVPGWEDFFFEFT